METEIVKILNDKKADLSPLSVKTYANAIHKVLELIESKSLNDLFLKHKDIIEKLKSKYDKPNTIKTKIASIVVLLRCFDNPKVKKQIDTALGDYGKEIEGLTGTIKDGLKDGEKSEKMKTNWLTEDDSAKLKTTLAGGVPDTINTSKDLMKMRNYVLYSLYEDVPTRNEMADAKIIYAPSKKEMSGLSDEWNYIVLDKKTKKPYYILNSYKTSKSYGQKHISLSAELFPLLVTYKTAVDKFNGGQGWAFLNNAGDEKLTRNRLGVIYAGLGKSIGKKLGTSLNRHIAISRLVPIDKMQKLADKMSNSITEQVEVYAKK